jgi:parvulin-like peptidyl-prolyl isomerase
MIVIRKVKDAALAAPPLQLQTNDAPVAAEAPAPPDARRKLAEEILAKLDAGDSFDSLAKLYSEGKEAAKGGDWGWIKRGELRAELSAPAFALAPGQHSPLIETADGYYILRVEDKKPERHLPLTEVRDAIEKQLLQTQRAKMQEEWVKQLRAKAYIRMF